MDVMINIFILIVFIVTYILIKELWFTRYRYLVFKYYLINCKREDGKVIVMISTDPIYSDEYQDMAFVTTRSPISSDRITLAVKHSDLILISDMKKLFKITRLLKKQESHIFDSEYVEKNFL